MYISINITVLQECLVMVISEKGYILVYVITHTNAETHIDMDWKIFCWSMDRKVISMRHCIVRQTRSYMYLQFAGN